ncbi:MAG: META domain-containing protein [Rikenella sp.]|nr:META domain-containing protein [Rikenella sp.]
MIKFATAILSAGVLFTACRNVGRSPLVLESDIWVAVEGVGGCDTAAERAGTTAPLPSLEFLSDGQLAGYTSCNSFFGSYSTRRNHGAADRIELTIDGITMALCPHSDTEQRYLDKLSRVREYAVRERRLQLKDSTGTTILVFRPASQLRTGDR